MVDDLFASSHFFLEWKLPHEPLRQNKKMKLPVPCYCNQQAGVALCKQPKQY